ncbi:MAG: hypothetical protein GXP38_12650 [Chloroflexi bacterium]|nr:hypothetical protein [Chloroflexota bacterium]
MKRTLFLSFLLTILFLLNAPLLVLADPPPAHQYIQEYKGPETCEICHLNITDEVMHSVHYTWSEKMKHYSPIAGSIAEINWLGVLNPEMEIAGGCGRCHIGGGIMPDSEAANSPEAKAGIDCLICHAEVYDMKARFPQEDNNGNWQIIGDRSLAAARTAARPTTEACLRCHLNAGGGTLFKRGLDFAPLAHKHADESLGDVHANNGLVCVDCHRAPQHKTYGFAPTLWSRDRADERLECADCHGESPHDSLLLNKHQRLDCRTCHVTSTGGLMTRDWTATPIYDAITGLYKPVDELAPANTVIPTYKWFNGQRLVPGQDWPGSYGDLEAKIQPFKIFQGTVPVNPENGQPWPLKLAVFYKTGDLEKAIQAGAKALGQNYTSWQPAPKKVSLQLSHGVVPADQALSCGDCHIPNGRLDFAALGYNEDRIAILESISRPGSDTPRPFQVKFIPNTQPLEITQDDSLPVAEGIQLPFESWSLGVVALVVLIVLVLMVLGLYHQRQRLR